MFVNAVSDPNQVLFCPVPSKRVHLRPDQQHLLHIHSTVCYRPANGAGAHDKKGGNGGCFIHPPVIIEEDCKRGQIYSQQLKFRIYNMELCITSWALSLSLYSVFLAAQKTCKFFYENLQFYRAHETTLLRPSVTVCKAKKVLTTLTVNKVPKPAFFEWSRSRNIKAVSVVALSLVAQLKIVACQLRRMLEFKVVIISMIICFFEKQYLQYHFLVI